MKTRHLQIFASFRFQFLHFLLCESFISCFHGEWWTLLELVALAISPWRGEMWWASPWPANYLIYLWDAGQGMQDCRYFDSAIDDGMIVLQDRNTISLSLFLTLEGVKVSILTKLYPHKPLREIKWSSVITGGQRTLRMAWCLIWWFCKHKKEYGHTWYRMSSLRQGVFEQHKFKLLLSS